MSQNNAHLNKPIEVIWFGDLVTPSGFGRIGNEVTTRLAQRGYNLFGLSMMWGGYPMNPLPYDVVPAPGPDWPKIAGIIAERKPDVVVCCQDFPYAQHLFHASRLDWSTMQFMIVTPVDGTPVHPAWLDMMDMADSTLVISGFGVEGLRLQGKRAELLPPGINGHEFYPAKDGEVAALREKLGIDLKSFVMGMFAMNHGRKCISKTVEVFAEFARDKPDAVLYLDMDAASPAGWNIPSLCRSMDPSGQALRLGQNVRFKQDAVAAGVVDLRERYLLCDMNSVVSHREGFGLPLIEAQACGIVAMALDWCSGPEIVGEGRGCLVRRMDYLEHGTWGNARDAFPDVQNWLGQLNRMYENPPERQVIAQLGLEYARARTWDKASEAFEAELQRVLANRKEREAHEPQPNIIVPAPGYSDDGADRTGGEHHYPGIQPPAESVKVPGFGSVHNQPDDGGGAGAGRLQPGLQPDGDAAAAGQLPGPE